MGIKVFWSEPIAFARESLRRFTWSDSTKCPGSWGGHDAEIVIGDLELLLDGHNGGGRGDDFNHADPRWPTKCEHCDYAFGPSDQWQHNVTRYYQGGGQRFILRVAPIGAMWDATWYPDSFGKGADGIGLIVQTPGGSWHVDGRASNCTKPDDKVHRCWCRHGDPRTGNVHVDKNGNTCAAGAGSIAIGSYHGFLHNGELT